MANETFVQEPASLLMEDTWQDGGEENVAESGFMEEWRETPGFNDMATIGDMLDVPAEIDWVSYVLVLSLKVLLPQNSVAKELEAVPERFDLQNATGNVGQSHQRTERASFRADLAHECGLRQHIVSERHDGDHSL